MSALPTTDESSLPTDRDLDRLARAVRTAAQERDLPRPVGERYLDWIFLFVAWCLKTPPGGLSRDRVGHFWTALSGHPGAGKAQICEAMDALGFLFGTVGSSESLPSVLVSPAEPARNGPGIPGKHPRGQLPMATNPDLRASDREAKRRITGDEALSRHLPDGALPDEVDCRAEVPTRSSSENPEHSEVEPRSPGESSVELDFRTAPRETSTSLSDLLEGDLRPGRSLSEGKRTKRENGDEASPAEDGTERAAAPPGDGPPRTLWNLTDRRETAPDRPSGESEASASEAPGQPEEKVSIEIPKTVADRLQRAASRLGLPPSVFAARAIDLVCDDAGVERSDAPDEGGLLDRYQTQLDLLHLEEKMS